MYCPLQVQEARSSVYPDRELKDSFCFSVKSLYAALKKNGVVVY